MMWKTDINPTFSHARLYSFHRYNSKNSPDVLYILIQMSHSQYNSNSSLFFTSIYSYISSMDQLE